MNNNFVGKIGGFSKIKILSPYLTARTKIHSISSSKTKTATMTETNWKLGKNALENIFMISRWEKYRYTCTHMHTHTLRATTDGDRSVSISTCNQLLGDLIPFCRFKYQDSHINFISFAALPVPPTQEHEFNSV